MSQTEAAKPAKYIATTTVDAVVTVNNHDVIDRVTGPNGDKWRSQFYWSIKTAEDVIAHLVFNAITNGVEDISRLDGWGDCDKDDVWFVLDDVVTDVEAVA